MIPAEEYKQIINVLPILCVDIVVKNAAEQYLLIRRANEPLKDQWWVIGGRVLKGETLNEAAIRKVKEETDLDINIMFPIGYYEDTSEINPFGLETPLHSVSIVFSAWVDDQQEIRLDYQSTDWKYSKVLPENFHIRSFDGNQDIP